MADCPTCNGTGTVTCLARDIPARCGTCFGLGQELDPETHRKILAAYATMRKAHQMMDRALESLPPELVNPFMSRLKPWESDPNEWKR